MFTFIVLSSLGLSNFCRHFLSSLCISQVNCSCEAGLLELPLLSTFTRASWSSRKGSRRSCTNLLLNRVLLYCSINRKLSFSIITISKMATLGHFSYSQFQSWWRRKMPSYMSWIEQVAPWKMFGVGSLLAKEEKELPFQFAFKIQQCATGTLLTCQKMTGIT